MKSLTYKKQISFQGEKIAYTLRISEQRNIVLRLMENEIVVSAPFSAEDWEIERLIYKNIHKILKYIQYQNAHKTIELMGNNKFVKIWGENHRFLYDDEVDTINNDQNQMVFKKYDDENETIKKIYSSLVPQYEAHFTNVINEWANTMGFEFKNLTVKLFKGKWGICYPTKSKILLNIRLVHYDKRALEYVCVHELAHLKYSNHSKDFWHLIEKYLPDYKTRAEILKLKIA